MKVIILTQGKKCLVDNSDFELYGQIKWYACKSKNGKTFYARNSHYEFDGKKGCNLHQLLIGRPPSKQWQITFKDGNSLNCQRSNLCYIRHSDNTQRHGKTQKKIIKSSKYLGVSSPPKRYLARLNFDGKIVHIGSFKTEIEAAKAYNEMAKKLFGNKAKLNDLPTPEHNSPITR